MPDDTTDITEILSVQLQAAGAEGLFMLRGLAGATLTCTFADEPDTPISLEITPPGVLLLALLPSDGGEPGVASF